MVQQFTVKLVNTEDNKEFILTLIYAKCDAVERIELWDSMYVLALHMTIPWLVGGDFNVIWDGKKKFGGLHVHINEVDDFRHCVNTCNLLDLGFKGSILHGGMGVLKRINRERHQRVQAELFKYLALEEEFWKQKSGMSWFQDGDRNTKLFHVQVNGRRKRLQLRRIQASDGNWLEENDETAAKAVRLFQDQFTEATVPSSFELLDHIPHLLNSEQNCDLMRQPTCKKVKLAVFGLNSESTGGPDDFNRKFFQYC
ncbi:uncharacterized protein LOC142169595 [Nicotiana tabacum]|uniref:Uncharacterized protein LOC142169595 n=1 Tax=Nicotiana tabacum TaxID=4097 RepID=A0AC58SRI1_TOBAC